MSKVIIPYSPMDKIIALAAKFSKLAATSHYDQISSVYNAAKSVASAAGKTDPALSQKANSVAQSAGRLLFNADKFGVSAPTSAKYHGQIQTALDDLKGYVANKNTNPYEDTVYSAVDKTIAPLQSALNSYIPESIAAQHPVQIAPQGKMGPDAPYASLLPGDKSNPFIPAKSPGPGYKVPSIDLPDQMPMAEQTIYPHKEQETVPGPNGERIALGPKQDNAEEGIAHQSFNFGPNKVGPASLGPQTKLPLSKHDQERANWELPQEANDGAVQAARLDMLRKIAKL